MKAKISLGSGGIKGLIVKHVEKAVVALAVLFFFLLVWRSSKLGGNFDLQPDQLQTTSVEADKAIREPKKGPDENVPPWEGIATELRTPIPAWPYSVGKTWMHRLFPGETLRGQPVVFPIEELRGSTGFGGIAIKPATPAGGVGAASPMGLSSPMGPSMPDAYASEYPGSGSGTMGAGGNVEGIAGLWSPVCFPTRSSGWSTAMSSVTPKSKTRGETCPPTTITTFSEPRSPPESNRQKTPGSH